MTEPGLPRLRFAAPLTEADLDGLADVLIDCVDGGASVNFMRPLSRERALAFWRKIAADVDRGIRIVLVAEDEQGIAGTVQLVLDTPENQPHRADLAKMLVHRRARRRGIGDALLGAIEARAVAVGRTLLVLDTAGHEAERLYRRHGWIRVGTVPDFALWPDGRLCDATYYYRRLGDPA
jgi:GNAT superfamily N-acetyltransferase